MTRFSTARVRVKMMVLLYLAVSLSVLVIFVCTLTVNFNSHHATDHPADHPADPPADHPTDPPADPPADHPTDHPADPPTDPPANRSKSIRSLGQVKVQRQPGLSSASVKGYIIVISFEEQLCSAVYDLYQAANVAKSWNMTLVEPNVQGSQFKFQSPPPMITTPEILHYSDVLDLVETNRLFKRCLKSSHDILTPFDTFAKDASMHIIHHVILIYFQDYHEESDACQTTHYSHALELKRRVSIYVRLSFGSTRNSDMAPVVSLAKVPHRAVCVDTRNATDFQHLLSKDKKLKFIMQSHSNILVLIPKWRGIRTAPHRYFYYDPHYRQPPCREVHALPHSTRIQTATQKYRNFHQLDHPFVGVHIRLERVIRRNRFEAGYMFRCVEEFFRVLKNLLRSFNSTLKAVAFTDYSESGSMTCITVGCKRAAESLRLEQRLMEEGVTVDHFIPAKFSEPAVTGYVAITELEILSQADYLVTLGYGSYHQRLFRRFYVNNGVDLTTKKMHTIEDGDGHSLFTVCSHM